MMSIPLTHAEKEVALGAVTERLEEVLNHLGRKRPDVLTFEVDLPLQVRPA